VHWYGSRVVRVSKQQIVVVLVVTAIGVASYGALGRVPPRLPILFNFSGHFRATQTLTFDSMWFPTRKKKILAYSFVTVYCMNFIIFLCVTLKLLSLSFAPNPDDANGHGRTRCGFTPSTTMTTTTTMTSTYLLNLSPSSCHYLTISM